jgi:hypothetical protein
MIVMETPKTRLMLGGVLLAIGLLSLLNNLDVFRMDEQYVLSLIFAGVGAAFVQHGWATPRKWTFYFGSALVLVGTIIFIEASRWLPSELIGTMFLWLGAGLLYRVFQRDRDKNWWVLLFAGPLAVAGLVVLLEGFHLLRGDVAGVLMMFGFAATFGYIYLLRSPQRKLDWAKFPAAGFFLIGVFILLAEEFYGTIPIVISGLFIFSGLYLIYRTVRADFGSSKINPPDAPTELPQVS